MNFTYFKKTLSSIPLVAVHWWTVHLFVSGAGQVYEHKLVSWTTLGVQFTHSRRKTISTYNPLYVPLQEINYICILNCTFWIFSRSSIYNHDSHGCIHNVYVFIILYMKKWVHKCSLVHPSLSSKQHMFT